MTTFLGPLRLPLLALACALLWGSAFPVIKMVYGNWPTQSLELRLCFAGIRFTIAGLLLLPFCLGSLRRWPSGGIGWLALLSLTQTFLQYVFFHQWRSTGFRNRPGG